jgi:hypothetical protein
VVGIVERPVPGQDPIFPLQPFMQPGAGIRREDGKLGHFNFCLQNKFQRAVENPLVIVVKTKHE